VERLQGQENGVGSRGAADGKAGAAVVGHLLLEGSDFRPHDDMARSQHAGDGLLDLGLQFPIRDLEITQGDRGTMCCTRRTTPFRLRGPFPGASGSSDPDVTREGMLRPCKLSSRKPTSCKGWA